MAGSDKKLQSFTAFNSGEYSKDLAGRTDLESFGSSTRYSVNFLSQVTGGLKKFYGTRHISEEAAANYRIKMIPFVNKYEPMVLVVYEANEGQTDEGLRVGLIHGDEYEDLDITLPNSIVVNELRWQQMQDRLMLCHHTIQPIEIDFYGKDENGDYVFDVTQIEFKEIPYFPVGTTDDYVGELQASGLSGEITIGLPVGSSDVLSYFPSVLTGASEYRRSTGWRSSGYLSSPYEVKKSTITLYRSRSGTDTALVSGTVNSYTLEYRPHGNSYQARARDYITREKILQVIKDVCPDAYINQSSVVLMGLANHQNGDEYYMTLSVGKIEHVMYGTLFPAETYESEHYEPQEITMEGLNAEGWVGRKIKFYFNDDTQIDPWWQGKVVSTGDYAYSNGNFYKATSSGTCGNVQPSHTNGIRSDGGVGWKYVHSGSNTGTVLSVDELLNTVKVFIPNGEIPKNTSNIYKNYAWSIWGKDGVHPSEIYMVGERLGFVCNTKRYGAWNSMSVTGDYFNFSTEEFGEVLDTSAIVGLIGNNESSEINWVLARKNLYMGGYSGEYFINPTGTNRRSGVYTPTETVVENISNLGGKSVVPLKYKELNMFVGITGKELYTIAYDYTTDDYTPKSMGYLTQHIMERGIRRIEALNNLDRNIYLLHDTNQLSLFNYAAEQKVLGFTELDMADDVVDFVTTHAGDEVAAYVATARNKCSATISQTRGGDTLGTLTVDVEKFSKMVSADGDYGFEYGVSEWYHNSNEVDLADYGITFTGTPHATDEITVSYVSPRVTFERLSIVKPNYMFDEITQGDGTVADFAPIPHFANRTVYIKYGDGFNQFVKAELDENGDVSHDPLTGVYVPQAGYFKVGIPMMSEMHTQPAFGNKIEGAQQQSLMFNIRMNNSGAFEYGSSVDFDKYFKYDSWPLHQQYGDGHCLYTGDLTLNVPLGYAEAQNQGNGKYPNTAGVGINIRSDTPEPLGILSIEEIYR